MSVARSPARASRVLLVVLLVALAVGAAASLILGTATGPSGPPVQVSPLIIPSAWVGYAAMAFFVLAIVVLLIQRLTGGSTGVPQRFVVNFLVALLILLLFVVIFRSFGGGGVAPTGAVGTGGNVTSVPPPPQNGSTNLTPITNGTPFLFPALPGWVFFAVVAVVAVFAATVALPVARTTLRNRRWERSQRRSAADTLDQVRVALEGAARQLDLGNDPRQVIVGLYGQFLGRLSPLVGWVDPETPEEIRSRHLLLLGIRPSAAETLTRLFEEARYSSHPLGPDHLARARAAIEAALEDLGRRTEATG